MNKFLGGILILFLVLPGVLAAVPTCVGAGNCTWTDVGKGWKDLTSGVITIQEFLMVFAIATIGTPAPVLAAVGGILFLGLIPYILVLALIAFLAIWMITYGFLKELRIFRRSKNLYVWIALLVALATVPTQIFGSIVILMLRFMGQWSVIVFALIFFVGMWRYMQVFNRQMSTRAAMAGLEADRLSSLKKELAELREARSELFAELTEPGISARKQNQLAAQIDKIDKTIQQLQAQISQAEESASTPSV